MSNADQLIERQHYASEVIEARCAELQETWDELTSLSATRHQYLQESLQGQQVWTKPVLARVCWCLSFKFHVFVYSCLFFLIRVDMAFNSRKPNYR